MRIQCIDNKTFELTDNSRDVGHLAYDSLFSFKAKIVVADDSFTITPKGFFSTTISVTNDGKEVASLQMNWQGHIIISYQDGREFRLKATGTFLNKYVLEDKDQQKLLLLDPDFNWGTFNYNYSISYVNIPDDFLLILLATYSANYYIAAVSSGY